MEVKGEDHEVVVKEEERKIKSEERAAGLVMTKESEIVDITRTIGCDGWKIREAHVGDHFERKRIIDEWIPTTGDNE